MPVWFGPYLRARLRSVMRLWCGLLAVLTSAALMSAAWPPTIARAQDPLVSTVLEIGFQPTRRAQIAIWIETADGEFKQTVLLTDLVARLGIGNRPGASQMNSGYRWPYGRREGVLPIWGTRRASAPGAKQFRRVIFQNRLSEGRASRTTNDQSIDNYYCLSFNQGGSSRDSLDAVSCASASNFSSDKGRYITPNDIADGYAEPFEDPATRMGEMARLSFHSLYPPRRDAEICTGPRCFDHADMITYRSHALDVMPELDAVTTATLGGDLPRRQLFTVPRDWPLGDYVLWLEINVEGDYNDFYNDTTFPTPTTPLPTGTDAQRAWDSWAIDYGYPYRGQPSIAYSVPFHLGPSAVTQTAADTPMGAGSWDWRQLDFGTLGALDTITDDPTNAPGSGADRLRRDPTDGSRLRVRVRGAEGCMRNQPPSAVSELSISPHEDFRHRHEWARLTFAPADDDDGVYRYEVRLSASPMVDAASFIELGAPAKAATTYSQELILPMDDPDGVAVDFGGMIPATTYYVGVRAIDTCNTPGEIVFTEFTTTEQQFTTVTPCFVATAAYGSSLASEVGHLRRLRDRLLATHAIGRAVIDLYYDVGPALAAVISNHTWLRDLTRSALSPIVWLAAQLETTEP